MLAKWERGLNERMSGDWSHRGCVFPDNARKCPILPRGVRGVIWFWVNWRGCGIWKHFAFPLEENVGAAPSRDANLRRRCLPNLYLTNILLARGKTSEHARLAMRGLCCLAEILGLGDRQDGGCDDRRSGLSGYPFQLILLLGCAAGFYKAADVENASAILWSGLSLVVFCFTWFVVGWGIPGNLFGQLLLLCGITVARLWRDRRKEE
jgi:hypothetical protein